MKKLLFIYLLLIAQSSYSADLMEVHVIGEKINNCNLSENSVTAALVGAMKYNSIKSSKSFSGVFLYHSVNAMKTNTGCVAHSRIEFKVYESVFVRSLNKKVMSEVVLCSKGVLLTGPEYDMQTRVNDAVKDYAQQCLLEISKL
jgi:hypothetical protein